MSIAYRPEIDGLRTVSVMLVIFNHLGWSLFSGGFIGVDVFFVISGYLITSIVYKEVLVGGFSFMRFYKRRVLRLAPAYFLVLIAVTIASILVMLPAELLNYFKSVDYSTTFMANFYMWKEVGGYFGSKADFVPLLHLWSLAVEEQFYIFWPVALLLLVRYFRKPFIFPLVLVGLIFSIAISEYSVKRYFALGYYLMPTRIFELMIGAILVFLPKFAFGRIPSMLFSLIGLSLILYASMTYNSEMYFPGLNAVLPCFGAALILQFSNKETDVVGKLLSMPAMVHLGKLSYPAYLWHWPMIAFIHIYAITIDWKLSGLIIVATIVLSQLTYSYLEIPCQMLKKYRDIKVIGYGFLLPALVLLGFSAYAKTEKGWPQRFSESINKKNEALYSFAHIIRGQCNDGDAEHPLSPDQCVLGVKNKSVDFLLVGDSHANHFTGMLDVMAKNAGLRGYDITQKSSIFLPYTKNLTQANNNKYYLSRNNFLVKEIKNGHYKAVILGGRFAKAYNEGLYAAQDTNIPSKETFEIKFAEAIDLVQSAGSIAVIINDTPELGSIKPDCTLTNERLNKSNHCDVNLQDHLKMVAGWNAVLTRLSQKYPKLIIIDPTKVICDQEKCVSQIENIPLYRDEDHLNQMGSELVGRKYISQYGNPLLALVNVSK